MTNEAMHSPTWVNAVYSPQTNAAYQGNPMIGALPPIVDDAQVLKSLKFKPSFDRADRGRSTAERFDLLLALRNFMVPLDRHLELARVLDSMMRTGYVGRSPVTAEAQKIAQKLYERQKAGELFNQSADSCTPQQSTSCIGVSGMGKTTTIKRLLRRYDQVIYHKNYHTYQITYLIVEAPTDGTSMRGLCHAILKEIDRLIPGCAYFRDYALKSARSADALLYNTARILNMHYVGLLVVEEIQNLKKSNKSYQKVIAELVSMCNDLKAPILFVGTNSAADVLSGDFRQARRAVGLPLSHWDRLAEYAPPGQISEWRQFMQILWTLQLVRSPTELDELVLAKMYEYSQGVIAIAINLFIACQVRAMENGSERITSELVTETYERYFWAIREMIRALRDNDYVELAKYEDIAPITDENFLRWVRGTRQAHTNPGGTAAAPALAAATVEVSATPGNRAAASENLSAHCARGDARSAARKPRGAGAKRSRPKPTQPVQNGPMELELSSRPDDLRNALVAAKENGTAPLQELARMGQAPGLLEVIGID